jgi:hypothetical protein
MQTKLNIRQYSQHSKLPHAPHFFVLCKGLNAGKPLSSPCANCFVVTCESDEEKKFLTALSWGLWTCNRFRIHIRGSVIPFIKIKDYSSEMERHVHTLKSRKQKVYDAIETIHSIDEQICLLARKREKYAEIKKAVFRQFLL